MKCFNCGAEFEKFRFEDPFQNTCKKCIRLAWYISEKMKNKLLGLKKSSLIDFINI